MPHRSFLALALATLPALAQADAPTVVADIAPVHSLVAMVMDGVAEPSLLLSGDVDPHHVHLRPSEAKSLQSADIVFVIGDELTPWMGETLSTLAPNAMQHSLLDVAQTNLLEPRKDSVFHVEEHDDDHGDEHEDHDDEHRHDHHGDIDPHVWMDPGNAMIWLTFIAETLSAQDPDNAEHYRRNAADSVERIGELSAELTRSSSALNGAPILALHDSYQYFEQRFSLNMLGAISLSDAEKPAPSHIRELRNALKEHQISCIFTQPNAPDDLLDVVLQGVDAKAVRLDPLGSAHMPGTALYLDILRDGIAALGACAS